MPLCPHMHHPHISRLLHSHHMLSTTCSPPPTTQIAKRLGGTLVILCVPSIPLVLPPRTWLTLLMLLMPRLATGSTKKLFPTDWLPRLRPARTIEKKPG